MPSTPSPRRHLTGPELGHASGIARRRRADAVRRIVTATRAAQGLPSTITDVEVLERVADLFAAGGAAELATPDTAA